MNSSNEEKQYYQHHIQNQKLVVLSESSSSNDCHNEDEKEKVDIDELDEESISLGSSISNSQQQLVSKSILQHGQQQFDCEKDCEEVKQVDLFGVVIIALTINNKERLCLAQISNTLLKGFSYNEIHNRRVALGITCVQCTPIQLEMLRRAGAMPSSSRRCGMITRREAERLCRSFLVEEQPPELPENFHFSIAHRVNYGCKGRFIPARYISSRAKCIECYYCGEFYSPNKFIFHSHRQPNTTDCNPPDSPNINSWRKHIDLDSGLEHSQDIKYAWEDVKSLFNGGTRRRAPNWSNEATRGTIGNSSRSSGNRFRQNANEQAKMLKFDEDQLIDVECDDNSLKTAATESSRPELTDSSFGDVKIHTGCNTKGNQARMCSPNDRALSSQSQLVHQQEQQQSSKSPLKRSSSSHQSAQNRANKRPSLGAQERGYIDKQAWNIIGRNGANFTSSFESCTSNNQPPVQMASQRAQLTPTTQSNPFCDFLNNTPPTSNHHQQLNSLIEAEKSPSSSSSHALNQIQTAYPATNFIYNQLYSQLLQPTQQQQQIINKQAPFHQPSPVNTPMDAQLALRQHIWSNLLANLQCQASSQIYNLPQQVNLINHRLSDNSNDLTRNDLTNNHLSTSISQTDNLPIKLQTSSNQANISNVSGYKSTTQSVPFAMHKFTTSDPGDI